jgi:TonB family protein
MKRVVLLLVGMLLATTALAGETGRRPGYLLETGKIVQPQAVRVSGKQLKEFPQISGDTPAQHYPPGARKAGIGGVVVVDLLVNDMGQVLEAQVVSESPPGQDFGLAALDAAKTYEFKNPLRKLVLMSVKLEFKP